MLPEIQAAFGEIDSCDILLTAAAGEERDLAARAIDSGCTTIVSVGGDGTSNNVANAIIRAGRDTRLAILPAGTGNDFAKTLGTWNLDARAVAQLSTLPSDIRVDVGHVENSYFLNSCGFGFDVAVIRAMSGFPWLRGNSLYVYAALRKLFGYRGDDLALDDRPAVRHMMLVIANSPHFGGAFTIAPDASVTDGELDAIAIRDLALLKRVALLVAVARGTHRSFREVGTTRAAGFSVSFAAAPWYQVDGELRLAQSPALSISCVRSALRVLTHRAGLVQPGAR